MRFPAILQESNSDVVLPDQDSTEEDYHERERSQPIDREPAISNSDDIPLSKIRSKLRTDANQPVPQEVYASSIIESSSSSEDIRAYFGEDGRAWRQTPLRQNVDNRA